MFFYTKLIQTLTNRYFNLEIHPPPLFFDLTHDGRITEITDMENAIKMLEDYVREYNNSSGMQHLDLLSFPNTVEHLCRVARILKQPRGNGLLLTEFGDEGPQIVKLAAFHLEYEVTELTITRNYRKEDWNGVLKKVMTRAGILCAPTVLLCSDSQMIDHEVKFLEDIATLMQTGTIGNLFSEDDRQMINKGIDSVSIKSGHKLFNEHIFEKFTSNVQQYLRVVVCLQNQGDEVRVILRKYPSLVTCATVDLFSPWTDASLHSVALHYLNEMPALSEDQRSTLSKVCVQMHLIVKKIANKYKEEHNRKYYVEESNKFVELLVTFQKCLKKQKKETDRQSARLTGGIAQLSSVRKTVSELSFNIEKMIPDLEGTTKDIEVLLLALSEKRKEAKMNRDLVQQEEALCEKETAEAKSLQESAERELSRAIPALKEAEESLKNIARKDITELKSMASPPPTLTMLMEALCIMLGKKSRKVDGPGGKRIDDYSDSIRALLADVHLMSKMLNYDKDEIEESTIKKLQPYIKNPMFTPAAVEKISQACKSVLVWILAMEKYYWISNEIKPLRIKLKEAKAALKERQVNLDSYKSKLQVVEERLKELEIKFEEAKLKKKGLMEEVALQQMRLMRATRLIEAIGGEETRWKSRVEVINESYKTLVGDILLVAAFCTYQGPFSAQYRSSILKKWRMCLSEFGIDHSSSFNIADLLADPLQKKSWNLQGLIDNHSIENAVLVKESSKYPLFIDPQKQARRWIMSMERTKKIVVLSCDEADFNKKLRSCIEYGTPVLLEITEEVDPLLDPVLTQQVVMVNNAKSIRIGDKYVPYNDNFRLYITSYLRTPKFSPELCSKVNLIDFTITFSALEDQLLTLVVKHEREDMELKKSQLIENIVENNKEVQKLEDQILATITDENVVEDETLAETLTTCKKKVDELSFRIVEATKTEEEINKTRVNYQPLAQRAGHLYFLVSDLAAIDHMYQFSLGWFLNLFINAISEAENTHRNIEARVKQMSENVTYAIYSHVSGSIYEKHKLLFSFLLCCRVLGDKIDHNEWRLLVQSRDLSSMPSTPATKSKPVSKETSMLNPVNEWMSDNIWVQLGELDRLPSFNRLLDHISSQPSKWKSYFETPNPFTDPLPDDWDVKLSHFQKLILLRFLRPDKVIQAMQLFVSHHLGPKYIDYPVWDFERVFQLSAPNTPIIILLSSGANPTEELSKYAAQKDMSKRFTIISFGQHQGPIAQRAIETAISIGSWVLLLNCHLASSWMSTLENITNSIPMDTVHPKFRLFLASNSTPHFPASILLNSVKISFEPAMGIRASLLRTFLKLDEEAFNGSSKVNSKMWKKMLFALSFFYAVIQDRRKFGPLGWNHPYEFNESDLSISIKHLEMILSQAGPTQFEGLKYLIAECNFGGKIIDELDRRTMTCLIEDFIHPDIKKPKFNFLESPIYFTTGEGSLASQIVTKSSPLLLSIFVVINLRNLQEYIKSLPLNDDPELHGIHENGSLMYLIHKLDVYLSLLQSIMSNSSAARKWVLDVNDKQILERSTRECFSYFFLLFVFHSLTQQSINQFNQRNSEQNS
jgi:dynein heavy chain